MGKLLEGLGEELILYVRHSAWLNAVPEKHESDKSKTPELSRLKKMQADGIEPEMPSVTAPHLIAYLWEVGPVLAGGMGESPLTFQELQSWQEQTGIELQSWEARLLIRLSKEYLSESHKATKRDCPAPWRPEDYAPNLADVARSLEAQMERLMDL